MSRTARRSLIALVVALVAAGAYLGVASAPDAKAEPEAERSAREVPVSLGQARSMVFERKLPLSGAVEARDFALVSPRVGGPLEKVFAREGDVVTAGKTKLFQTDSLKLTKAVEIARQVLAVAKCAVREKQANAESIDADRRKARLDFDRAKRLVGDRVISKSEYDEKEQEFLAEQARLKHAKALVDLAREQAKQAELSLAVAEKDLRDSLVLAPIDGVVAERFREPGEMGVVGGAVVRIENPKVLEVSAYAPEEYYGDIEVGKTPLRVRVGRLDLGRSKVSYKSPTVSSDLRTFEIKCVIEAPPRGVAPGRIAHVEAILGERKGVGAPRDSVERRGGKAVVFTVRDGKAKAVVVVPGIENDGWVEMRSPDGKARSALTPGAPVIVEGQDFVEDGTPVSVVRETK